MEQGDVMGWPNKAPDRNRAVLDACVLYPTILREILLDVAGAGLFMPLWSARILEEWRRAAARLGPQDAMVATAEAAQAGLRFPDAGVTTDESLADGLDLPDSGDAHVVATALTAGAGLIITANLRDFPKRALAPQQLQAIHPDSFLTAIWAHHPRPVEAAVHAAHQKAENLGGAMKLREMMKRARLTRLFRAMQRMAEQGDT